MWTTAMLFFQVALVLGYAYAHWSITCPGAANPGSEPAWTDDYANVLGALDLRVSFP